MNEKQKARFAEALQRLAGDEQLLIAMGSMVLDDAPAVIADLRQLRKRAISRSAVGTTDRVVSRP